MKMFSSDFVFICFNLFEAREFNIECFQKLECSLVTRANYSRIFILGKYFHFAENIILRLTIAARHQKYLNYASQF